MPPLPLQVDNVFGCAMGLSYVIVTILIFTLQVRMPAASACQACSHGGPACSHVWHGALAAAMTSLHVWARLARSLPSQ